MIEGRIRRMTGAGSPGEKRGAKLLPAKAWTLLTLAMLLSTPVFGGPFPPGQGPVAGPYVLSPGDQLDITVLDHDELKGTVTILPDGTFTYPLAGTVHAGGLTVAGLTRTLAQGFRHEVSQPRVVVTVRQTRPRQVSVLGAVHAPGQYDVRPDTRLLDVLAAAGGLAQDASRTRATLVSDGGKKSTPIDVPALVGGVDPAGNRALAPGDVLLVEAKETPVYQVQVSGEVAHPATYPVPPDGASVRSLLVSAGGPMPGAALSRAQVMHAGKFRTVDLRTMNQSFGNSGADTRLVAGDVLLVPRNTATVSVLGDVHAPAVYPVPDGEALSVMTALSLAGGVTDDGDKKRVSIVRRAPGGQVSVRQYDADALFAGRIADAALQPGDVLYVPTRRKGHSATESLGLLGPLSLLSQLFR